LVVELNRRFHNDLPQLPDRVCEERQTKRAATLRVFAMR
jgi:hypothetical protein